MTLPLSRDDHPVPPTPDRVGQGPATTEHSALLTLVIAHCTDGLIVIDDAGRLLICNNSAIDLLQLPPEFSRGQSHLDDLLTRPSPNAALQAVHAAVKTLTSDPCRDVALGNGAIIELSAVRTTAGNVVTCKDVTFARQAKRQLAECEAKFGALEERFNEVIGSVMREVTDRQNRANELAAAKVAAEAATEAKSVFLASMSHEVRTPLNGILGFADLLLDDRALSVSARRITEKLRSAGNALLSVVNDILDFSEIEAGGAQLNCRDFSLTSLIESTVQIIEPQILKKGLRLDISVDPAIVPRVHADDDRLRQVLLNILNNAVKFTAEGAIRLSVSQLAIAEQKQTVQFEIEDTGIGIPADSQNKLFERFSQVDATVRRRFGGTGLGLAISKQLVHLMGGHISCRSIENQGSTFTIVMELGIAANPRSNDIPTLVPALSGKRILLVEDVEINSEIAQAMIVAAGYSVDVVTDGASAIAAVKDRRYDLILMDIQMPDMDGITATQHIRRMDMPASGVPIVAMTAHVLSREVERFLAVGMNDHIGKPFKRAELHAKIATWCATPAGPVGGNNAQRSLRA